MNKDTARDEALLPEHLCDDEDHEGSEETSSSEKIDGRIACRCEYE